MSLSTAAPIEKVSIRPGVSVLSVLRHLNYKPWFALAEFVDNGVQSSVESRDDIRAVDGDAWRLRVSVEIEFAAGSPSSETMPGA